MALTDDEFEQIRAEIGDATPPTDLELDEIHDRVDSVGGVVYEVTSKRLADLLASPASFTVSGEYSQSTEANIKAYQALLEKYASFSPVAHAEVKIHTPVRRRAR